MEQLGREERADAVERIQRYFREERGETVGELAAEIMLDFIEAEIGPAFYNRGVRDAKAVALRVAGLLDEELETLEIMTPKVLAAGRRTGRDVERR